MEHLETFADERLTAACAYCGGAWNTKDHVPSKVLLDKPYPDQLPWVGACRTCNSGFSGDEEYLACLIDCALVGTAMPCEEHRPTIRRILEARPRLAHRIQNARIEKDDQFLFTPEYARVDNVILKLARGHALYELSESCMEKPDHLAVFPRTAITEAQLSRFEVPPGQGTVLAWPEIGSRAMQRLLLGENPWVEVQSGRYRYLASANDGQITIRTVLSEYLYCEVAWNK